MSKPCPTELRTVADCGLHVAQLRAAMGPHDIHLLRSGLSIVLDWPANTEVTGEDLFVLSYGTLDNANLVASVVTDFEVCTDQVGLIGLNVSELNFAFKVTQTLVGDDLQIAIDGNLLVTLRDVGTELGLLNELGIDEFLVLTTQYGIVGTVDDDLLVGTLGADEIYGLDGNDMIFGLAGTDKLVDGTHDDTYVVDDTAGSTLTRSTATWVSTAWPADVIVELAGGGYDRVVASLNSTLGAELERLSLTGTADLNGTGNALANRLDGNAGANILDGGASIAALYGGAGNDTLLGGSGVDILAGVLGEDSMAGGANNDTYHVDDASDGMIEAAGGGYDRVYASLNWTLGGELERLSLTGTANLNGTGNSLANRIDGHTGANILDGGAGNDTLLGGFGGDIVDGGLGADRLEGGAGAERFSFGSATEAAGDAIGDFSAAEGDKINLRLIDADEVFLGDQGFAWIGNADFSGVVGQLRFANETLQGDLNGEAVADFQI